MWISFPQVSRPCSFSSRDEVGCEVTAEIRAGLQLLKTYVGV